MENGTQTQGEQETVIVSETTKKLREAARILEDITRDKDADRAEKYQARQALQAIRLLVSARMGF